MTSKRENRTKKQILSLTFLLKSLLSLVRLKVVDWLKKNLSLLLPHANVLILTSLKAPEFDLLKTEPKVHLSTMILSTKIQKQK